MKKIGCPKGNKNHLVHGGTGTRLYSTWKTMRQRCNCKTYHKYKNYGARGIIICNEWNDFAVFREWSMSNGYSDELSIDRINNDGNYSPDNCRWVNNTVQSNNRRSNRMIVINGIEMTMAEFCRKYDFDYKYFMQKINREDSKHK